MTKKIIHLASLQSANANPGVVQQMRWEREAALHAGLDWGVELWSLDHERTGSVLRQVPVGFRSFVGRRFHFHRRIREAARTHDVVIIRHAPLDPFGLFIPERIRKKTWYVFHTPTDHYLRKRGGRVGPILAWFDRLFSRAAIGKSAGVIGVTDELIEHERMRLRFRNNRVAIYPNGIFLDDWDAPLRDRRVGALKVIFIASQFFDWNGLEQLLASIVACGSVGGGELHLVGQLLPHQQEYIEENKLDSVVIRHGVLPSNKIKDLLASMALSLGAFALNLVKAQTACTLKVRDSLAAGVPVYSGHSDVAMSRVKACYTEGIADWGLVLKAAQDARHILKEDIRALARDRIDKVSLMIALKKALTG